MAVILNIFAQGTLYNIVLGNTLAVVGPLLAREHVFDLLKSVGQFYLRNANWENVESDSLVGEPVNKLHQVEQTFRLVL